MQVPSYVLMDIPRGGASSLELLSLSPLGDACSRMDLTAIHEILEKVGYKDDEGTTNEVRACCSGWLGSHCSSQLPEVHNHILCL